MNRRLVKLLFLFLLLPALAHSQSENDVNVIPDNQRHDARFIPERRPNDRTSDSTGTGAFWFNTTTRQWKGDTGNSIFTFGTGGSLPSFIATANFVFAGPASGTPAEAVFRALVAADIPNLDAGKITTGVIPIARGGTNANSAAGARSNLELVIGTNIQAWDADLDTIALLAKTDNSLILGNGTTWVPVSLPSCSNTTTSKLLYNTTTRTFSCGTDQTGGGGGSPPGGSDKNVQYNDAGTFNGVANNATATVMYLKQVSAGTPAFGQIAASEITDLAASATTDTTNATNITSGTLAAARIPALSTLSGAVTDAQVPDLNTLGVGLSDGCVEVASNIITSSGAPCSTTPTIPTFDEIFDGDSDPTITGATEAKPFVVSGNNPDYALVFRVTTTNSPELLGKCGGVIGDCNRTFPHNTDKTTTFLTPAGVEAVQFAANTGILSAPNGQIIATSGDSATGFFTTGTIEAARLPAVVVPVKSVQLTAFDYTTDVATGTGKAYFRVPVTLNNYILTGVQANVITAGTTGTTTIRLTRCVAVTTGNTCSGTTVNMFTTDLSIDSGESDSSSAATPVVIDTADDDVTTGMVIRVDVQTVSTTAPKGLIVNMDFSAP